MKLMPFSDNKTDDGNDECRKQLKKDTKVM